MEQHRDPPGEPGDRSRLADEREEAAEERADRVRRRATRARQKHEAHVGEDQEKYVDEAGR